MTDVTPWAVDLSFADLESTGFKGVLGGLFGGAKKDGDGSAPTLQAVGAVFKQAPLYGENTPLPLKKTLSITRSEDFEVIEQETTCLEIHSADETLRYTGILTCIFMSKVVQCTYKYSET